MGARDGQWWRSGKGPTGGLLAALGAALLGITGCSGADTGEAQQGAAASTEVRAPTSVADSVPGVQSTVPTAMEMGPDPTYAVEFSDGDPRALPEQVMGYPLGGEIVTSAIRVFVDSGVSSVDSLGGQANRCDQTFWALRWRSLGPYPVIFGRAGLLESSSGTPLSDVRHIEGSGFRGYATGFGCEVPVLGAVGRDDALGTLFDVVVEYRSFSVGVDEPDVIGGEMPSQWLPPAELFAEPEQCTAYDVTYELPLSLCDEAVTVRHVQGALANRGYPVEDDSQFGPGTFRAVRDFQKDQGIFPDGVVGRVTWAALMDGYGLPGFDLDGDGVVYPDELGH